MKTMCVNGCDFELGKDIDYLNPWRGYLELSDCYKSVSQAKRDAYEGWEKFFYDTHENEIESVYEFGIISYNGWGFTIGAIAKINGVFYQFVITKDHNRIAKIKNL